MKIPNPKKLHTDIPLMGDEDVMNWVEDILKNTNLIDLQILAERLNEAIDDHKMAMVFERVTNMCDRCDITYPEHITECKCGNDRLRSFRIHNNLVEILK